MAEVIWLGRSRVLRAGKARVVLGHRDRKPPHLLAGLRVAELNRLFEHRYGRHLPDDDAGLGDCWLISNELGQLYEGKKRIVEWLAGHAPWLGMRDMQLFIDKTPRRFKADTLGRKLGLTDQERKALDIRTIGAIDCPKKQRLERARKRKQERDRLRRLKAGMKPQTQSTANLKPWKAQGISRATWYRRARKG